MEVKNKANITILIISSLVIFLVGLLTFTVPNEVNVASAAFNMLLIYYPFLFLLQGIITSLSRTNLIVSLLGSIGAFLIVLLIWMNSSALGYIIIYAVLAIIGFSLTDLMRKKVKK